MVYQTWIKDFKSKISNPKDMMVHVFDAPWRTTAKIFLGLIEPLWSLRFPPIDFFHYDSLIKPDDLRGNDECGRCQSFTGQY
ncbi:MAG: hypothetical protein IPH18_18085 [Chitinophagaceae bacterium]|nr:hypothetical protein [Chitinophagaceae bacterium]